jgi:hypothetical protein
MRNHHITTWSDLPRGTFAEGQADPERYPEDRRIGRFSDGQSQLTGELVVGRFSAGVERHRGAEVAYMVGILSDEELAA